MTAGTDWGAEFRAADFTGEDTAFSANGHVGGQQEASRADQARAWLQQDPQAYWTSMAAWVLVTFGQRDWHTTLAMILEGDRPRDTARADAAQLIGAVASWPGQWTVYAADLWPLIRQYGGPGEAVIDRARALPASRLPGWHDDRQLVAGRIYASQLTLLHGAPAAGKGAVILDFAFRGALGLPWFGAPFTYKVRTLILYPEGTRRLSKRRDAWCMANGYSAGQLGDVVFYPLAVPLNERAAAEIIAWCRDDGFGQVIADNVFSMTAGQDIRGPEASGEAMSHLVRIKDETGGHVLAVHHDTKVGTSWYGGVPFDASPDTRIHANSTDGGSIRRLSAGKNGDGKQRDLRGFAAAYVLDVMDLGYDTDGHPVSSCAARQATAEEVGEAKAARDAVTEAVIAEAEKRPGESATSIAKRLAPHLGKGVRTIQRIISDYRAEKIAP